MEDNILELFHEEQNNFTIFVVEIQFATGRGLEYFKKFKGKENYVNSNFLAESMLQRIVRYITRKIPKLADLIDVSFATEKVNISHVISALCKLFSVNTHQAAGPKVIDPIIIEEQHVSRRLIAQLVELHKESILRPAIIILLRDNDFNRAKEVLKECPNGLNVKLIRNSGDTEVYKIINQGASSVHDFIDLYAHQCFGTCSKTSRKILLADEWANSNIINHFAPSILQIKSNLLYDEKECVKGSISDLLSDIENYQNIGLDDEVLIESFACMLKLFKVYSEDCAGKDLNDAHELAEDLGNEILLAHVYRYADLFRNLNRAQKVAMLEKGQELFLKNGIADHALYCDNNMLIQQFYSDSIALRSFKRMQQEAQYNVPGLVGMSIIYNNVGVAYLYSGMIDQAVFYFQKGLDYSRERIVQRLGLKSNLLIAKHYAFMELSEQDILSFVREVFDLLGTDRFPFISANYIANAITISASMSRDLLHAVLYDFSSLKVLQTALKNNQLGSGSLSEQICVTAAKYGISELYSLKLPQYKSSLSGIRRRFIQNHALNPVIFNAWL